MYAHHCYLRMHSRDRLLVCLYAVSTALMESSVRRELDCGQSLGLGLRATRTRLAASVVCVIRVNHITEMRSVPGGNVMRARTDSRLSRRASSRQRNDRRSLSRRATTTS